MKYYLYGFLYAKNALKKGYFRFKNYKFLLTLSLPLSFKIKKDKYPVLYFSKKEARGLFKNLELENPKNIASLLAGILDAKAYINPKKRMIRISGKEYFLEEIKKYFLKLNVNARKRKLGTYFCLEIEGLNNCKIIYNTLPCILKKQKLKSCLEYHLKNFKLSKVMECLFEIPKEQKAEMESRIKEDDIISRQSLKFREIDGKYYLFIEGSEEAIKKIKEDLNLKEPENKEEIIKKIKEEEEKAIEGFGAILS